MADQIFKTIQQSYYKVEADTPQEALRLLENCEDLTEFETFEYTRLEDTQPEFHFVRSWEN